MRQVAVRLLEFKWRVLAISMAVVVVASIATFGYLSHKGIPLESESSQHEREEQKFVPYQVASEIPRKIRQQRNNAAKLGATEVAP